MPSPLTAAGLSFLTGAGLAALIAAAAVGAGVIAETLEARSRSARLRRRRGRRPCLPEKHWRRHVP